MKVQYTGLADFSSCGIVFNTPGQLATVTEEVGKYLTNTFSGIFNIIEPTSGEAKDAKAKDTKAKVIKDAKAKKDK